MSETFKMVLEILILTGLFYVVLRFLLETRGTGVIRGLTILGGSAFLLFFVLINSLDLHRLKQVFSDVFQVSVVALIVIFHPEIRRAITHIGENELIGRLFGRFLRGQRDSRAMQQILLAVQSMARNKIGALIAIERVASLLPYTSKGTTLDAEIDHMLLESIFFPGNPLHDGAVIIQGDTIVGAGCVLPLSDNEMISRRLGTRHRAALGLSEQTDAMVLVVSEETGTVSVFSDGRMYRGLRETELRAHLGLSGKVAEQPREAASHA